MSGVYVATPAGSSGPAVAGGSISTPAAKKAGGAVASGAAAAAASAVPCVIATQFEVDHAREAFPCVDVPEVRQKVQFFLQLPAAIASSPKFAAWGNGGGVGPALGALAGTQSSGTGAGSASDVGSNSSSGIGGAMATVALPPSALPIPTYVAGFILSTMPTPMVLSQKVVLPALDALGDQPGEKAVDAEEVTVHVVRFSHDCPFEAPRCMHFAVESLTSIRAFLRSSYGRAALWIFAVPSLPLGGMENDGIIFLKRSIGVFGAAARKSASGGGGGGDSAGSESELARYVAHEVAHHWIGNRVGMSFTVKEGIALALERYFGNQLLGIPGMNGFHQVGGGGAAAGASSAPAGEPRAGGCCGRNSTGTKDAAGGAAHTSSSGDASGAGAVAVEKGKELSGLTYHRAEVAMAQVAMRLGWPAFGRALAAICDRYDLAVATDADIGAVFRKARAAS
jgi:hypothetical protein